MRTKAYRTITLLGLFFALAASASAQSGDTRIAVPFDFYAGTTQFPAGTYLITPFSQDVMKLRSADGRTSVLILATLPAEAQQARDYARLIFRRYGGQYFLAEIWSQADIGCRLYMSGRERNLVKGLKREKMVAAKPLKVEVATLAKR